MKKTLFTLMLATSLSQAFASSFYKQLCQFNPNWKEYTDRAPKGDARVFPTDREYIQAHLEAVLHILRTNPTNQLSRQQHIARKVLMHELDVYRQAGLFPHNYYRNERIPVFIDEHNTYCAVGHLMRITGYDAMAIRIAAKDNYVWVKDINDPELSIWQEASGFTVAELKLIQGAYDSYMPGAFFHPEKYDIPQQPQLIVANFEEHRGKAKTAAEKIWCKGEGKNGVLHGTWIQNYAPGMPWIVGYYENGKRTGQWEEYYQGTQQLCRTENWRNDKLNGVRRRFDRQGNIIEEIVFKDGNAVVKTNFDLDAKLTYVRTPIDSALVYTQIFTAGGALIAKGHEKVHNPGGLLWFQNIELTALNSMAITARDASFSLGNDALSFQPQY